MRPSRQEQRKIRPSRLLPLGLCFALGACGGGGGGDAAAPVAAAPTPNQPTQPAQPDPRSGPSGQNTPTPEIPPVSVEDDGVRYSVFEIDIDIPSADSITLTQLGDNRSVAGTWTRVVDAAQEIYDTYPFVEHANGKLEIGFEELLPDGYDLYNMDLSHYEGQYLAGQFQYRLPSGACAPVESYILDSKNDSLTPFGGGVSDLSKTGDATGNIGGDPCAPFADMAFHWNGELFEPIPDHTPASYGLRLKNGTVEGIQSQSGNVPDAEWDTVFVWDLATGIVTHYLPGDPAGPSFEPEPVPDAATLHEKIDEDDFWYGRLTFTRVIDVNVDGCILVDGCSTGGCGSFVLIPAK